MAATVRASRSLPSCPGDRPALRLVDAGEVGGDAMVLHDACGGDGSPPLGPRFRPLRFAIRFEIDDSSFPRSSFVPGAWGFSLSPFVYRGRMRLGHPTAVRGRAACRRTSRDRAGRWSLVAGGAPWQRRQSWSTGGETATTAALAGQ